MAQAGIVFRIGGALDPSYRGALAESVTEAKASAAKLQRDLRAQLRVQNRELSKVDNNSYQATPFLLEKQSILRRQNILYAGSAKYRAAVAAEEAAEEVAINREKLEAIMLQERMAGKVYEDEKAAMMAAEDILENERLAKQATRIAAQKAADAELTAALIRDSTGAMEWAAIEEEARTAVAAEEAAKRIAIARAEQLAEISMVARKGGMGAAAGGHGHKYGGQGGVISEIAVIGHEFLQGRGGGRILGSISILAQRLGFLGTIIKSTAKEEIKLAIEEEKMATIMAQKALATEASTVATIAEKEAAIELSIAQNAIAKDAVNQAEQAAAVAKVSLGPIGWLLLGIGLLVAGVVGLVFHFKHLRQEQAATAERMGQFGADFKTLADETDKATDALKEHSKWLKEISDDYQTVADLVDDATSTMDKFHKLEREKAKNAGASPAEMRALDVKQAQEKIDFLTDSRNAATGEALTAKFKEEDLFNKRMSPESIQARAELDSAKKRRDDLASIIGNIKTQIHQDNPTFTDDEGERIFGWKNYKTEAGGGFKGTIEEARAQYNAVAGQVAALTPGIDADDLAYDESKKRAGQTKQAQTKVEGELRKAAEDLILLNMTPLEKSRSRSDAKEMGLTENQRRGAQIGGPMVALIDVAKNHLAVAQAHTKILTDIKTNTGRGNKQVNHGK